MAYQPKVKVYGIHYTVYGIMVSAYKGIWDLLVGLGFFFSGLTATIGILRSPEAISLQSLTSRVRVRVHAIMTSSLSCHGNLKPDSA